jgi:chromosome segregation ATPase
MNAAVTAPTQEEVDLEQIKNRITMSEGELKRLNDLQRTAKTDIDSLVKHQNYLDTKVAALKEERDALKADMEAIAVALRDAEAVIANAETILAEQAQAREALIQDGLDQEADLAAREQASNERRQQLDIRERNQQVEKKNLMDAQDKLDRRHRRIRAFADELLAEE